MKNQEIKPTNKLFFTKVQTRMFLVLGLLVGGLFIVQFFILSTVGTVGPKISEIRKGREELQVDNELKTALIRDYQTNQRVVDTVSTELQMQPTQVNYLQLNNFDSTNTATVK